MQMCILYVRMFVVCVCVCVYMYVFILYVRMYVICMRAFGLRIVKVVKYRARNQGTMVAQKQFLTYK